MQQDSSVAGNSATPACAAQAELGDSSEAIEVASQLREHVGRHMSEIECPDDLLTLNRLVGDMITNSTSNTEESNAPGADCNAHLGFFLRECYTAFEFMPFEVRLWGGGGSGPTRLWVAGKEKLGSRMSCTAVHYRCKRLRYLAATHPTWIACFGKHSSWGSTSAFRSNWKLVKKLRGRRSRCVPGAASLPPLCSLLCCVHTSSSSSSSLLPCLNTHSSLARLDGRQCAS